MPQPEFKSPTHNCEFNKKVHNLLLEAVSEKDHKFFANSAGDVEEANDFKPEMYANVHQLYLCMQCYNGEIIES